MLKYYQPRDRRLLQLQEQDDNSRHQSDSEDAASVASLDSSLSNMQSDSLASTAAKQSGAIRKSGWLNVKNWLVHKKRKVELAPQRAWRRYWVCLKGTVLLFFKDSQQQHQQMMMDAAVIEGCIAQPLPEHPKKENVLSLSTAFGDAYMFQALDKTDLDSWIAALHSACASQIARQRSKSDTVYLMETEIRKLEGNIDVDSKMKMMAEKQLTAISDSRSRQTILRNIQQWEENLERLLIELYRHRCYMTSLLGQELPNPKVSF
uniref:PH domain-containing protein n=1 Tax=Macrostomum lignano TaxID=282301 RepID=A0A1I8IX57_9PLAT